MNTPFDPNSEADLVRLEAAPLDGSSDGQSVALEILGLSENFPRVLEDFNRTLSQTWVNNSMTSLESVSFTLHPDIELPKIEVEERRRFPFTPKVDVGRNGMSKLSVLAPRETHTDKLMTPILKPLYLADIYSFTQQYPGGFDFHLVAHHLTDPSVSDPSIPFNGETTLEDLEQAGMLEVPFLGHVLKGALGNASLALYLKRDQNIAEGTHGVTGIEAVAQTKHIEEVIGAFANLIATEQFDK